MSEDRREILNLLGFLCPVPVHETRRALENCVEGELVEVLCDDPDTLHDIPALCDRLGANILSVKEESGELRFIIQR
tara:strand:- start:62 stop:292 length:231 start_codon:yes stop_codon:yes gene_type:complete